MGNHQEMARLYDWPAGAAESCLLAEIHHLGWTVDWVTTNGKFWARRGSEEVWAPTAELLERELQQRRSLR